MIDDMTHPRKYIDYLLVVGLLYIAYIPNHHIGDLEQFEAGLYLSIIYSLQDGKSLFGDLYFLFGPLLHICHYLVSLVTPFTFQTLHTVFFWGNFINSLLVFVIFRLAISSRSLWILSCLIYLAEFYSPYWSLLRDGMRYTPALLTAIVFMRSSESINSRSALLAGLLSGITFMMSPDQGIIIMLISSVYLILQSLRIQKELYASARTLSIYFTGIIAIGLVVCILTFLSGQSQALLSWLQNISVQSFWIQKPYYSNMVLIRIIITLLCVSYCLYRCLTTTIPGRLLFFSIFSTLTAIYSLRSTTGPQFFYGFTVLSALFLSYCAYFNLSKKIPYLYFILILVLNKPFYDSSTLAWLKYQLIKNDIVVDNNGKFLDIKNYSVFQAPFLKAQPIWVNKQDQVFLSQLSNELLKSDFRKDDSLLAIPSSTNYQIIFGYKHISRFTIPGLAAPKESWRQELVRDIKSSSPRYLYIDTKNTILASSVDKTNEQLLPEVYTFIRSNYDVIITEEEYQILKLKN